MEAQQIRAAQAPLKARYRDDPSAARSTLRAVGRLLPETLSCRIETGFAAHPIEAGIHPMAGGPPELACAGDMLLESLAACAGVTLCAVAAAMSLPLRGGTVTVEGDMDFRGTLGVARDAPVGFTEVRVRFDLDGEIADESRSKLLELTERYCVVFQTLKQAPKLMTS